MRRVLPALALCCLAVAAHARTLAETLKPAGYFSALVGKWHLGGSRAFGGPKEAEDVLPQKRGFDVNIGGSHYGQPPEVRQNLRVLLFALAESDAWVDNNAGFIDACAPRAMHGRFQIAHNRSGGVVAWLGGSELT